MATVPNVEVNNVLISETTGFGPTGQAIRQTTISYMLGTNGPFRLIIPSSEFSRDSVKALIAEQQMHVRGVLELQA